jgi:hypothetical protein
MQSSEARSQIERVDYAKLPPPSGGVGYGVPAVRLPPPSGGVGYGVPAVRLPPPSGGVGYGVPAVRLPPPSGGVGYGVPAVKLPFPTLVGDNAGALTSAKTNNVHIVAQIQRLCRIFLTSPSTRLSGTRRCLALRASPYVIPVPEVLALRYFRSTELII